jgi:hypothetical protein
MVLLIVFLSVLLGALTWDTITLLKRRKQNEETSRAKASGRAPYLFGYTQEGEPVGFTEQSLRRHTLALGAPGTGKSRALCLKAKAHLEAGHSLIVLDPHGTKPDSLYQITLREVLGDRRMREKLILIDPSDSRFVIQWNPTAKNGLPPSTQAEFVLEAIQKASKDFLNPDPKPQHERWLLNVCELLIRNDAPLIEALDLLRGLRSLPPGLGLENNDILAEEWGYFVKVQPRRQQELTESVFNRLRRVLASPALQAIFSQPRSAFRLAELLQEPRVILVNLGTSPYLSRRASTLLGTLLLSELVMALELRGKTEPHVAVIADEASRYVTCDMSAVFAELRGYGCSMTLAAQSLSQLDTEERQIMETVLACSETLIVFRVGYEDALRLGPQLLRYDPKRVKDEIKSTKFEPRLIRVSSSSYTSGGSRTSVPFSFLAQSITRQSSSTTNQSFATDHRRFEEITSRTFFGLEEQIREAVELLLHLPDRRCVLKDSRGIVDLEVAHVPDANLSREEILKINEALFTRLPFYARMEDAEREEASRPSRAASPFLPEPDEDIEIEPC